MVEKNPQLILVSWCGVPFSKLDTEIIYERSEFKSIDAVLNHHSLST